MHIRRPGHRLFVTFVFLLFVTRTTSAFAEDRGFVNRVYRDETGSHKYVVFVPHNYTPEKTWPVILSFHGAGERGSDGKSQVNVGLGAAIRVREQSFPFIAVFPQCEDLAVPARQGWLPQAIDGRRALAILAEVEKSFRTDEDRVYLTGVSMGGFGAWAHAAADPDRWAAVVPICGGADADWAAKLVHLPIWCFHGAIDRVVPTDESRQMIAALKKGGGNPRFTEFPGVGHNAWDIAYQSEELFAWLLAQRRGVRPTSHETPQEFVIPKPMPEAVEGPFVPALEVPRAVLVRLGNEMLAAIGDSLPHVIPADALSGTMPDVHQTTNSEGRTLNVQLRGISYNGRVSRAVIEARGNDRIVVTVSVRDVKLIVNRTYVSGDGISATVGPLQMVLGHREDLPVAFEVRPVVEERRLRLKLLATQFRLPPDNWRVDWPEWVHASGAFVTDDRVASGLRSGLYNDPGRIEREVKAAVPRMLEQLENQFALERIDQIVAALWPLPVYKPRLKTWPSEIRVDESGATIALGVSVAAFDPRSAPPQPKVLELAGNENDIDAMSGEQFRFGVALGLMEPLSSVVVAEESARAHISDMPLKNLHALSDATTLAEIVPELKRHPGAAIRAELQVARPIKFHRGESESDESVIFELPKVNCLIAVQKAAPARGTKPEAANWVPFLNIEFGLRHAAKPSLSLPTPSTRMLVMNWQGHATIDVQARFDPGYSPRDQRVDKVRISEILAAAWREWTETGTLASVSLEDFDVGFSKLRHERLNWTGSYLTSTFGPAGMTIKNQTQQPVAYEIKGPYSAWGGPYTLEPNQEHQFPVAYPVTCRFRGNQQKEYTLPAGSQFEFQATEGPGLDLYASRDEPTSGTQQASFEEKAK